MNTGTIVTDLHRVWLKDYRAQIEAGNSVAWVASRLTTNRIEQFEAGRMNMVATIDAVIEDIQGDEQF